MMASSFRLPPSSFRPVPSARSICAMSGALDRGRKPGVEGCLSIRTTYDQFSFSKSAMDLALVTFAVEIMISFSAKVHGHPVLRHGQSFARNSRSQRTLGGSAGTCHCVDLSEHCVTCPLLHLDGPH